MPNNTNSLTVLLQNANRELIVLLADLNDIQKTVSRLRCELQELLTKSNKEIKDGLSR